MRNARQEMGKGEMTMTRYLRRMIALRKRDLTELIQAAYQEGYIVGYNTSNKMHERKARDAAKRKANKEE